jgi:hypothetical protein
MPRQLRKLIYSSEDWNLMQSALFKATKKLHRAQDHEDTDRLARRVMTLFDRGLRDINVIARAAANQEILIARIVSLRSSGISADAQQ